MSTASVRNKEINHEGSLPLSEVVESLGFGRAQIIVLLLGAGGVFLVEGTCLVCFNAITISAASDLGLSHDEHGLLTTMSFIGLFAGVACSGYFADNYGRRLPIILAYVWVTASMLAVSMLRSWVEMTLAGMGTGFGIGLGMPASIAFLSEVTPVHWRMMVRAATALAYCVGAAFVCVVAGTDDPTLVHLDYRAALQTAIVPSAVLFVLSAAFLPESPVFLASIGNNEQASVVFQTFASRNGREISGKFEPPSQISKAGRKMGVLDHLSVIFSPQLWYATLANTYAVFCANLTLYGCMYGNPQIFVKASALPAAWQTMISIIPGATCAITAGFFVDCISRRAAVIMALAIIASSMYALCVGGGVPIPRSAAMEILFQYGILFNAVGTTLGFTVMFQLAVEIYPSTSSAFGASFIIGFGRLGAIIAPELFDFFTDSFGTWQSFYSLIGTCSCFGIVAWVLVNTRGGKLSEEASEALGSKDNAGYMTMVPSAPNRA